MHNISITRGATFTWPIEYLDNENEPIDLSNITGTFELRPHSKGAAFLTEPVTITGNQVEVTLTSSQTDELHMAEAYYVLWLKFGEDDFRVLLHGKVSVLL